MFAKPVVHIKWEDSMSSASSWTRMEDVVKDAEQDILIDTVGILWRKNRKYAVVLSTIAPPMFRDSNWGTLHAIKIPTSQIIKIKHLGKVKFEPANTRPS